MSWYVVEGEKRTEYADGVQRKLEAAYRDLQSGSGPQFPTVTVTVERSPEEHAGDPGDGRDEARYREQHMYLTREEASAAQIN